MEASESPVKWGRVNKEARCVLIIAAGPSLQPKLLPRLGNLIDKIFIIAINQTIKVLPKANAWFTLDPNELVLPLMAQPRPGVEYIAAVPNDYGLPTAKIHYHRREPCSGISWLRRRTGNGPWKCCYGLSDDHDIINTGNSAYGALGVAYLMNPDRIGILGLDGTSKPYGIVEGAPRTSFNHLPDLFASSLPQLEKKNIEVLNGSPASFISCFRLATPEVVLNWLES